MMIYGRLVHYVRSLVIICFAGYAVAAEQTGQNGIHFTEIKQYADFAGAAYLAPDRLRDLELPQGYELTRVNNIPGFNIIYFILTNDADKTRIIAVRGTSNTENAMVDAALQLTPDKHTGIRLHNGFSQAALAVYDDIRSELEADYVISTTGHSLGGAVALILAMHLDVDRYNIGRVITFGQPKVTNINGADKFQHLKVIRVVTPKDLVPLVPPLDVTDINNIDIYWHQGIEVILLPDTNYAVLEGINSMLRATRFTQEPLSENNLKNHQMALYLQMIDKKIPTAKLVEFKNSLNLFNLFGGGE